MEDFFGGLTLLCQFSTVFLRFLRQNGFFFFFSEGVVVFVTADSCAGEVFLA